MIESLRDWWRGYSDADIDNARRRVAESASSGSAIGMTSREYLALVENPVRPRHAIGNAIDAFRIENEAIRAAREDIRREGTMIHKAGRNTEPSQIAERPSPPRPISSTIDEIFAVRVRNNVPWKRLIEIAMKHAPEETKAALRDINANDREISDLMTELAK